MLCPVDQTVLQMSERQGVEIDYCPQCRGVWLDRGELDKIIDRSVGEPPAALSRDDHPGHRPTSDQPPRKKRKESFLGELFDF
jgi:Zn-finger nucleic acid-binding protein